MNGNFRNFAIWLVILFMLMGLFQVFQSSTRSIAVSDRSYSQFVSDVDAGKVSAVTITDNVVSGTLSDGTRFETVIPAGADIVLTPKDIDVVELYDAFTINPILFLEDLGFCAKGEGGAFISGGRIAPGGDFPMNTNGGGLSCVHPGMYSIFLVIEAVTQLRREAGSRQVADAGTALVHGNGGVLSSQATAILSIHQ